MKLKVVFMLVIIALGCEEKIKPPVIPLPQAELPSQESWNSTIRSSAVIVFQSIR